MALIFSSVDRHNYGDLLYPVIINKILFDNDKSHEQKNIYSFVATGAIGDCGYSVNSISDCFSMNNLSLNTIIIGGGDSLRVDKEVLAEHCSGEYNKLRKPNLFQKLYERIFGQKHLTQEFISKFMSYDAPGPFILDSAKLSQVDKVIYCSCGVPFEFPERVKKSVATAFNNASFIYLRDEQSKQKLINAGVKNEIYVAPDIICSISDFFDFDNYKGIGLDLLYSFGLEHGKRILTFQSNPTCLSNIDEIIHQLLDVKGKRGYEIVLLPLGYCHDDDYILKEINNRANNQFVYADVYSIFDMLSIIAASSVFIGTSMHGNITAFSYGIPHLIAPINVDKMKGFLHAVDLTENLMLQNWDEITSKLDFLETLDRDYFSARAKLAKVKINNIMSEIAELINES